MQLLEVPPKSGYVWLRQGIWLFRKNPLAIMTLLFAYLFGMLVISIVPVVGGLVSLVLVPGLSVGFMAACRDIIKNKQVLPQVLLDGFRGHGKEIARRLLILGGYYMLATVIAYLVSSLFDGSALLNKLLFDGSVNRDEVMNGTAGMAAVLAFALAYIPVAMLFWFAPILVAWHDIPPVKAIFFSWTACVRNFRAFVVYGLCVMLLAMATAMILMVVMAVLGIFQYVMLVIWPLSLLFAAIMYCTFYASYRGCFGVQEIGAIDPNVSPPEA
ncbi:BPSS1780 family membrane protein [Pandoraea sp. NPDC087047]|uniref:BPSS1780 family membrane protein n=1 Tax=Pandoraea sp. NPDC087047 TaxID=3364390 RepID=UPI0037F1A21A